MQFFSSYKPMPLQFSPSQIFFDKQKSLLQRLGFLSPTNIDVHIKYSFQLVEANYFIQGAEIEGFNTDHETNEQAILYKLGLANPMYKDIKSVFIDLEDIKSRMKTSLGSFPIRQRVVFLFLMILLPKAVGSVWSVVLYINLTGI